jgi:hypothetical protein
VIKVVTAEGPLLVRVLAARCQRAHNGLSPRASDTWHAAQMKTTWGRQRQRTFALTVGREILASAEQYDLTGAFEGRAVRICGIGSVQGDGGHASQLVDRLIDAAARRGVEVAVLFSDMAIDDKIEGACQPIRFTDVTLSVAQSPRYGAPMTMVRGGEERDLAAIVAMGRVRAEPFRFHLDRDVDFVQYVITSKRLLAGLGAANARQLHFFIAEEGITAAAYVVLTVVGASWTLEECGDRDVSGARVGALLQALIAREPMERRPTIRGWLPPGFMPPQVTIASATPSAETIRVRVLQPSTIASRLSSDDVLFWRNDLL